jgi:uncharacterized protein (TIGR03435 family)
MGMVIVLASLAEFAQGQAHPEYEAAAIKVNTTASANSGVRQDRAQVQFTRIPLKRLIQLAYKAYSFQVSGPAWLEDAYFDISAKYPPNLKDDERPLMLRSLLEDRLKLVVHRESKETQGYALVVAKGGFKLKPARAQEAETTPPAAGQFSPVLDLQGGFRRSVLIAKHAPISSLADLVTRIWDQMVVDKTGLIGVYDFELRWNNDNNNPSPSDADALPVLFTAIQETLGLRLQPEKVPVEMIVVQHVERAPVEN